MPSDELDHEIAAGVTFWCHDEGGAFDSGDGLAAGARFRTYSTRLRPAGKAARRGRRQAAAASPG
jgi:hypothetical protein